MSTSAEIHTNGHADGHHDHILRPRAVKPGNPAVIRAMSEDGLLAVNAAGEITQNGNVSGQTR